MWAFSRKILIFDMYLNNEDISFSYSIKSLEDLMVIMNLIDRAIHIIWNCLKHSKHFRVEINIS